MAMCGGGMMMQVVRTHMNSYSGCNIQRRVRVAYTWAGHADPFVFA